MSKISCIIILLCCLFYYSTSCAQQVTVDEAKALMDEGKFDEAIVQLNLLQRHSRDKDEMARILRFLAVSHAANMDEDLARMTFKKAFDYFDSINDNTSTEFLLSHFEFGKFNFQFNDFTLSIEHMNVFLLNSDEALKVDTNKLYAAHNMISYAFRRIGDFEKALEHMQRKYDLLQRHERDEMSFAIVHYYLAGIYYEMSEYQKSVNHFEKCIALWERDRKKYKSRLQSSYSAAGDMYWKLGMRDRSLYMYDQEAGIKYEKTGTYDEDIDDDALRKDRLSSDGDYEKLLAYFQDALNFRKAQYGEEHPVVAGCNNYVADAMSSMGHNSRSLALYQESICLLVKGFHDTSIFAIPDINAENYSELYLLEAIEEKAIIFYKLYSNNGDQKYLSAAYEHFNYAIDLIDKIRSGNKNDLSKLFWADRSFPIYEQAINCCYEFFNISNNRSYINEALSISERSKAFLLMETLREAEIKDFANVPADLLNKERELEVQIYDYNQKIFYEGQKCGEISEYKIDLWKDKVYTLSREHDKLIATLRNHNSEYFKLKYSAHNVEIGKIQSDYLNDDQMVLEYYFGIEFLYVFSLTNLDIQWKKIPVDSTIHNELRSLMEFGHKLELNAGEAKNEKTRYIKLAHKYFDLLLSDFVEENSAENKSIIIIPDGVLHYVPFELLLTEETDVKDFRILPYLIRNASLSYANSMNTLFRDMETRAHTFTNEFVGFAPSYISSNLISDSAERSDLYNLRYNTGEIQEVSGYFTSQVFLGKDATVDRFKAEAQNSKIIHLAMHSILEDEEPMYSKLMFAKSEDSDGVLNAYELFGLSFKADLAVLSACNTGVGKLARGEGVMSLSRGFQYANIPSLLVSLWTVDDLATSVLIKLFYKNLQAGMSKGEALRLAKISFLEQTDPAQAHPYYWAGLKLVGKDDILTKSAMSPIIIILCTVLLFGFLIIGVSKL